MSRYIDADKLKETLANYHPFTTKQELKFDKIIKIINEEPTVEATEKITGEWIPTEEIKEALEKQIPKNLTISMMDTLEERTGEDVGILHRQNSQSKESS